MARAVDEVFVFFERHLGVLRAGLTGPLRADPPESAAGAAIHENLAEGFAGSGGGGKPFGIDVGERLGVFVGPDAERSVDALEFVLGERGEPPELFLVGLGEEDFRQAVERNVADDERTATQRGPVTFADQRRGDGFAIDGHDVARFQFQ